jgi:predicted transcriptional regulator
MATTGETMGRLQGLVRNVRQLFEEDHDGDVDQAVLDRIWEAHPDPTSSRTLNVLAFEGEWDDLTIEAILADLKHCNESVVLTADVPILEDTGYFRYTEDGWHVATRYQQYRGEEAEELLDALHGSDTSDVVPARIEDSPFE